MIAINPLLVDTGTPPIPEAQGWLRDYSDSRGPAIDLSQDGTRYFDLHHTPDDTLDKVDRAALAQNVDAWAAVLGVVANAAEDIAAVE